MNQNIPEPFENLVVPEGFSKLDVYKNVMQPNTSVYILRSEDHTIGNLIRSRLLKDDHVLFAGYRIIHPMKRDLLVRIRTDGAQIKDHLENSKITWTPIRAFNLALSKIDDEFGSLMSQ